MSDEYYVEIPVVLKLMVGVKGPKNVQEAIDKVKNSGITIDVNDDQKVLESIDCEWEMHDKVVDGNTYYGSINEIYVTKEE